MLSLDQSLPNTENTLRDRPLVIEHIPILLQHLKVRARAQLLYRIRGEHFLITLPKVRSSTHVSRRQPAQSAGKGTAPGAFPTQWANMHRSLFIKLVNTTLSKVVACLHPERIDPKNIAAIPATSPASRDRNPSITGEFDQNRSQSKRQGHFLHWRPFCSM